MISRDDSAVEELAFQQKKTFPIIRPSFHFDKSLYFIGVKGFRDKASETVNSDSSLTYSSSRFVNNQIHEADCVFTRRQLRKK